MNHREAAAFREALGPATDFVCPTPSLENLILSPSQPLISARTFVATKYFLHDVPNLWHQNGVFFAWNSKSNTYVERDVSQLRADLYRFLDSAMYFEEDSEKPIQFKPTQRKVSDVLDALRAASNLRPEHAAPCWLDADNDLDPRDIIPCLNGLLHVPSRRLLEGTPNFFALSGVNVHYDPEAKAPAWDSFLKGLWADDIESIGVLQELFGYLLTPRTHLQKVGLLVGPKRSGKGTIGRVLRALVGENNFCAPTLASLSSQFGLAVLINKSVAIIGDARISGRTDTAIVAERLLSISGEDCQSVPRKFLPDWTGKLTARFVLMTNELPWLEDASGALASRFVILTLRRSFFGCEDHALFEKFIPEMPGILNWALDGWAHLSDRGRFVQPAKSAELVERLEDLGSPVAAFLKDECETGAGYRVTVSGLYEAWRRWCARNGRDRPGTTQVLARNVHAAAPYLAVNRPRTEDGDRERVWEGIRLKDS